MTGMHNKWTSNKQIITNTDCQALWNDPNTTNKSYLMINEKNAFDSNTVLTTFDINVALTKYDKCEEWLTYKLYKYKKLLHCRP